MTTQDEGESSFAPLSDADLASILEAQLAQLRGSRVPSQDEPVAAAAAEAEWTDELFDAPTQEMTATEVAAVRGPEEPKEAVVVVEPVFAVVVEPAPAVTAASIVFAAPAVSGSVSGSVSGTFAEPMMFSASEMQRLMEQDGGSSHAQMPAAFAPVVAERSDVEQQLMDVLAKIQAIELAQGQGVTAVIQEQFADVEHGDVDVVEEVLVVDEVLVVEEVVTKYETEEVAVAEQQPNVAKLSFDDILFGTSPDE